MKRLQLHIAEDASEEITAALEWWRSNRTAVPDALKDDLQRGLDLIRTQPGVGARALNTRLPGVRRLTLSRVRYHVYYALADDGASIEVLRFWHSSRGKFPNIP